MDKYITSQHYSELLAHKVRADLLQADLDAVDEMHYDEIIALKAEIALLKQRIKFKRLN